MRKVLYIDPIKCTGCRTCELVCSIRNEGIANPSLARIRVIAYKDRGTRIPLTCQQCEDPPCSSVCPSGALQKDKETGIVRIEQRKCLGCKLCVSTCPFGGISINPESRSIFKCQHCDGDPQCVRFCEDNALTYVEVDAVGAKKRRESASQISRLVEIARLH